MDQRRVRDVLSTLIAVSSIAAALLATEDGDVVEQAPASGDAWEAESMAQWAAGQIEALAGLRNQIEERELSVLYDPGDRQKAAHCHLASLHGHVLVIFFADRDAMHGVRSAARELNAMLAS